MNVIIGKRLLTIITKVVNQNNFMDEFFRTTIQNTGKWKRKTPIKQMEFIIGCWRHNTKSFAVIFYYDVPLVLNICHILMKIIFSRENSLYLKMQLVILNIKFSAKSIWAQKISLRITIWIYRMKYMIWIFIHKCFSILRHKNIFRQTLLHF